MKHHLKYGALIALTIIIGLASRNPDVPLHPFLSTYMGDTLWALMVYWGFRFVFQHKTMAVSVIAALVFSYLIEISQFYQADWANALREYKIVGLIFGYGFLWSDVICYAIGVLFGYAADRFLLNRPASARSSS